MTNQAKARLRTNDEHKRVQDLATSSCSVRCLQSTSRIAQSKIQNFLCSAKYFATVGKSFYHVVQRSCERYINQNILRSQIKMQIHLLNARPTLLHNVKSTISFNACTCFQQQSKSFPPMKKIRQQCLHVGVAGTHILIFRISRRPDSCGKFPFSLSLSLSCRFL